MAAKVIIRSRSKYGVSAAVDRTYNGVTYHSKAEAKYAAELDLMERSNKILSWSKQVGFPITIKGCFICKVVIDFYVLDMNCNAEYIEIKGHETAEWKLKKKLLLACYPDINLRVIKA